MTSSNPRRLASRAVATISSASLGVVVLTVPIAAEAASPAIDYTCTSTNGVAPFTMPVVIDTNAPARVLVGETLQVSATTTGTVPGETAKSKYDAGARSLDGPWTTRIDAGGAPLAVTQTIPRTALGDQEGAGGKPVVLVATGSFAWTAPSTPGAVELTAGGLSGTWKTYDQDGNSLGTSDISCLAPNGKPPVVDTVAVVTRTTTSLTLSKAATQHGEDVTATAKVTGTGAAVGAADGEVAFSVDGKVTTAKVDKDGVASVVLPDAAAGAHTVTASFVPKDGNRFEASASPAQAWTVSKVGTKVRVPVTGKKTGTVTRVGVKAKGAFDTVPTGKVKIKLKRIGKPGRWVKVRKLDDGAATAGFGKLARGRYKVVVKYRGDANHLATTKTKNFRVKRS